MEGVVYLDKCDRQMVLQRTGRSVALAQCGLATDRRFTFYDQVHTTGMDIAQAPSARSVLTIGKDMTFRDYAQGAYRMRGIGKGQCIHLFIIPEVQNRIVQELGARRTGCAEMDVPAWLLVNSMRMENLQFVKLSMQELQNVWRKRGLELLKEEVRQALSLNQGSMRRLRRFIEGSSDEMLERLRRSVRQFCEPVSYAVEDGVPRPRSYEQKLQRVIEENMDMTYGEEDAKRLQSVASRMTQVVGAECSVMESQVEDTLNAEVVREQEQEAEEKKERNLCSADASGGSFH